MYVKRFPVFRLNRVFPAVLLAALSVHVVAAADFATEMMEATFKWIDQNGSASTCFLVRREAPDTAVYLVSVANDLESVGAENVVLVLREGQPDGSYKRHDYKLPVRRNGEPLWVRHEKQNVAVLRIAEPLPVPVAALPVSLLADEACIKASPVELCSPLFILTYPQGLESDASGLPVARKGSFASPPRLPITTHPTFFADYSACPGDNGAPVFIPGADNHPLVVGVVLTQQLYVDNMKSMYEEHVIRTPLNFGKILHTQYLLEVLQTAANRPVSR